MQFDLHVGIDYSGAGTSLKPNKALQVYSHTADGCTKIRNPFNQSDPEARWTRKHIADWIIELAKGDKRFIVGIDHAFSHPNSCLENSIRTWDDFLAFFVKRFPTHIGKNRVRDYKSEITQLGNTDSFRLTDTWSSSAKSIFKFDVPGQVGPSTHAGIPWLYHIRQNSGGRVHFWPFDGWSIPGNKHAVVEVYPALFEKRYPRDNRTGDEHSAYSSAQWLHDVDKKGFLERYLNPPLTEEEREQAEIEGWILGSG